MAVERSSLVFSVTQPTAGRWDPMLVWMVWWTAYVWLFACGVLDVLSWMLC